MAADPRVLYSERCPLSCLSRGGVTSYMCDEWMPQIRLPLNKGQFHQLPRNPAYRYEFLNGEVVLSPRAQHYHAILDLEVRTAEQPVPIAPLSPDGIADLAKLFSDCFRSIQPYGSLDDETRLRAARHSLER